MNSEFETSPAETQAQKKEVDQTNTRFFELVEGVDFLPSNPHKPGINRIAELDPNKPIFDKGDSL